jgi:putative membrane protein
MIANDGRPGGNIPMAISIKISVISATIALVGSVGCDRSSSDSALAEAGPSAPLTLGAMDAASPLAMGGDAAAPGAMAMGGDAAAPGAMAMSSDAAASRAMAMSSDAAAPGAMAMSGDAGANYALTDAQIVAIVTAANLGEVDQAHVALPKATGDRVKSFAQHMVKDHTKAGKELADLASKESIVGEDSDTRRKVDGDGKAVLSRLQSTPAGADFDRKYMDTQIEEHQDLLTELDTRLIPSAKDDALVSLLKKVRAKVADHLKMARDIESSLSS